MIRVGGTCADRWCGQTGSTPFGPVGSRKHGKDLKGQDSWAVIANQEMGLAGPLAALVVCMSALLQTCPTP